VTSDELRAAFLGFFENKGHKIILSSSLIPHGDPTLLLTSAGMVQFKPYYLGEAVPPNPRLASCQKCFRTTDIESVGNTKHLTFFEMLGNFSIGDYFKKEAIAWAWEFVTEKLKLPKERLWVTIFLDDDEAFGYWQKIGIPEKKIVRFGEKDNFWGPAGDSGPCGPCSEIHYDFGEEAGCHKPDCRPGCDCGRYSEIWNLVFTQYNQDKDGKRTPLPRPNIDTGMGLERTAAVVQGKTSVYETDLFTPLLKTVSELTSKKYGTDNDSDNAIRIIAEHSRGIAFLIADGVLPSNEGRGYVLRRLLRRAALFGRRLGLERPFLSETAKTTMKLMGRVYPELVQRRDFILKVIELEEMRFNETLNTGLELISDIMTKLEAGSRRVISGEDAFRLYDTYGFPVELTKEIAAGRGFDIDLAGFEKEMEKQRERAREAQKFRPDIHLWLSRPLSKQTTFVGYSSVRQKTVILSILVGNDSVAEAKEGQEASLILESTPFYGEMGGQVGDTGEIRSGTGRFEVTGTIRIPPDIIVHQGKVTQGSLRVGDGVEAEVDVARRLDIARNHTATHLLQAALRQVLGEHIQQRGSLVAPERLRFDFSHLVPMTKKETQQVNSIVNERIRQNLIVWDEEIPYKQAKDEGAIALFDEKYGDMVRVLRVGQPPISAELCGGTHVTTTGEIGFFHIISESSIGAGLRRIEAVTGRGAEAYVEKRLVDLEKTAEYLETEPDRILEKAESVSAELKEASKRTLALERELSKKIAESLLAQVETVKGIKVLAAKVPSARIEVLREMSDRLREQLKSAVVVLGTVSEGRPVFLAVVTPDLVARGYNAGEIVKKVAKVAGGSGGGKATLAQAGGKYKEKVDEALKLVKSLI
jgi:alanyl-tRNA synthetase